ADHVASEIAKRSELLKVGDPLDPATRIGAIASAEQLETIERMVESGRADGAQLVSGGERLSTPTGRFYAPTVFGGVAPGMAIAHEEIFGPVVSVPRFETL